MIRPLIVGLGSAHGDDQAGWRVIERLHARGVSEQDARSAASPATVCDAEFPDRPLIVCDAADDGRPRGTISVFHWPEQRLPMKRSGTHDVTLEEALSLGAQLGAAPGFVSIWVISGHDFRPMRSPSPEVTAAAVRLGDELYQRWFHA